MLEVGAFHPAWGDIHLGPDNALKATALLGGGPFLPVHWGTFSLAMHAWTSPPMRCSNAAPKAGAQLLMPRLGGADRARAWRAGRTAVVARHRCGRGTGKFQGARAPDFAQDRSLAAD